MSQSYKVVETPDDRGFWDFDFEFDRLLDDISHIETVILMRERISVAEWCVDNIDPEYWTLGDDEVFHKLRISVYNATAAAAFKLRWC